MAMHVAIAALALTIGFAAGTFAWDRDGRDAAAEITDDGPDAAKAVQPPREIPNADPIAVYRAELEGRAHAEFSLDRVRLLGWFDEGRVAILGTQESFNPGNGCGNRRGRQRLVYVNIWTDAVAEVYCGCHDLTHPDLTAMAGPACVEVYLQDRLIGRHRIGDNAFRLTDPDASALLN